MTTQSVCLNSLMGGLQIRSVKNRATICRCKGGGGVFLLLLFLHVLWEMKGNTNNLKMHHPRPQHNTNSIMSSMAGSAGICARCWAGLWWPVFTMWWSWVMVSQSLPSPQQTVRQALPCAIWCLSDKVRQRCSCVELLFFFFFLWLYYRQLSLSVCASQSQSRYASTDCIFLGDFKLIKHVQAVLARIAQILSVVTTEGERSCALAPDCRHQIQ